MKHTDKNIETVSNMLAAAYWRGRLSLQVEGIPAPNREAMIKAASVNDAGKWKASAKALLSMLGD